MNLHVNIIFIMVNMKLQKNIYFKIMQIADQDAKGVLALAENILKKLQTVFPHIIKAYAKLDSANCYHNSLGPQAHYRTCKNYDIDLCR